MPLVHRSLGDKYQISSYSNLIPTPITNISAISTDDGVINLTWSGGEGYMPKYTYSVYNNTGSTIVSPTAYTTSGTNPTTITLTDTTSNSYSVTITSNVLDGSGNGVSSAITTFSVITANITDINGTSILLPYTYPPVISNYGNNWFANSLPSSINYEKCAMSANGQIMVVCEYNVGIWVSSNYGSTWTKTYTTGDTYNVPVCSSSGKYIYITANSGNLYYSSNYGSSFTISATTTNSTPAPVISYNEQYVFVYNSTALNYSSNYGSSFTTTAILTGGVGGNYGLSYTGGIQIYNNGTTLYISKDYGSTWTSSLSGITGLVQGGYNGTKISADGKYILSYGNNGSTYTIYVGSWTSGVNYNWTTYVAATSISSIKLSFTGQYMMAFSTNAIYYSSNYGVSWSNSTITIPSGYTIFGGFCPTQSLDGKYVVISIRGNSSQLCLLFQSKDYGATFIQTYSAATVGSGNIYQAISMDGYYQLEIMQNVSGNSYCSSG